MGGMQSGACSPGNFGKTDALRLNLGAFHRLNYLANYSNNMSIDFKILYTISMIKYKL